MKPCLLKPYLLRTPFVKHEVLAMGWTWSVFGGVIIKAGPTNHETSGRNLRAWWCALLGGPHRDTVSLPGSHKIRSSGEGE